MEGILLERSPASRRRNSVAYDAGIGASIGAVIGLIGMDLHLLSLVSYWGNLAPFVVAAAAVGAALFAWRPRFVRGALVGIAGVLMLLWLAVAFTPLTRWMAAPLVRRDAPAPADAVLVLSSRLQADGEMTAPALSRLLGGIEAVAQGHAPRLVLTEIEGETSYAEAAAHLATDLGVTVPIETIGPISNTHDEALSLAALFAKNGWHSAIVVTSPSHSRRAAATVEATGVTAISRPAMETRFDYERLDRPDERLLAFGTLTHEYVGLAVYRARGWM